MPGTVPLVIATGTRVGLPIRIGHGSASTWQLRGCHVTSSNFVVAKLKTHVLTFWQHGFVGLRGIRMVNG